MKDNENIVKIICEKLEAGFDVVLASIVGLQGSSPRHGGSKMVIDEQGKSYGTIGGSLLEATAITEALAVLQNKYSRMMTYDLAGDNAYAKGMICGGKASVLLDFIPATPENTAFFSGFRKAILSGTDIYFLTVFQDQPPSVHVLGHTLLYPDGEVAGSYKWPEPDLAAIQSAAKSLSSTAVVPIGHCQVATDPIKKIQTLYCFGAGHVALPTAHVAALAGFRVVVIDDRSEFANLDRFPDASEIHVIEDFSRAMDGLTIDHDSYIVIVTRGHAFDRVVLEQALNTKAGYIGMISSRRKRDAIYSALMAQGIRKEALERVRSPIGIPIGGETPAEISISIVAELIKERYNKPS